MNTPRLARSLWLSTAVVALASAFSAPHEHAAADVTAGMSPDSITGLKGHMTAVALRVDMGTTGKSLGSYAMTLTWDSTVVRLDSVRAGDFAAPAVRYVNAGQVNLSQATSAGSTGAFALARLYFRIVSDTTGKRAVIQPTFTEVTAGDFTNLLPVFAATGAVVRVQAPQFVVGFSPDSLVERLGAKPVIALVADLTNAPDASVGSYTANITWDSTVIRLDSVRSGFGTRADTLVSAAELHLTAADAQGRAGLATLATLYFRYATNTFPVSTTLSLLVTEMHEAQSFADLLPGATLKSGKVTLGGVLRGDIDVSGAVAALDAQLILQAVVGLSLPATASALPNGDADCNGALRALDAQIVLNQVVGNDVSAFCVGKIQ